jgi:hypothetical protein
MSGDHNQYQKPTSKDSLQVEAMRQALSALVNTGTHPMMSAERYDKEMRAMEALDDAIEDAIEQAEKQQPVAWTNKENLLDLKSGVCSHMYAKKEDDDDLPLYTAPPQRTWVGLTDDEVTELFCDYDGSQFPAFVRAIESKLRKKNTYL